MVSKRVNHELHRVPHSEVTYQTRNTVSEHISMHQVACVASVPVRAERNNRAARRSFAFRTRRKWGESKKGEGGGWGRGKKGTLPFFTIPHPLPSPFLLSPHFPRVLNAKLLLAALLSRSARTGTLATQAMHQEKP